MTGIRRNGDDHGARRDFACEHYKNEKDGSELWASDKVTPFGMVKQTAQGRVRWCWSKSSTEVPGPITGPVTKFDMQQMMQQMQQRTAETVKGIVAKGRRAGTVSVQERAGTIASPPVSFPERNASKEMGMPGMARTNI